MFQIIYMSTPAVPFSPEALRTLLQKAQTRNRADGLTGLLLFTGVRFLQVLEGDDAPVRATYARIERDPRHKWVAPLISRPIAKRQFAEWSMAYEEADAGGPLTVRLESSLENASLSVRRMFKEFSSRRAA